MAAVFAILLATSVAAPPQGVPAHRNAPRIEVMATARIVRGAAIRFDERRHGADYALRDSSVKLEDGARVKARLVEFE